jgi:hypothetical protein
MKEKNELIIQGSCVHLLCEESDLRGKKAVARNLHWVAVVDDSWWI